jgi:diacylglycerol O-acyltransferase/trehalose O-mycolyltransferase
MPDIGLNKSGGGYCTDWPGGLYNWETFHIAQLLPWIDANLHTVPVRAQRAVAGLSEGGFCSASYGARHPDLFGTVLTFSGAVDIAYDANAVAISTPVVNVTETVLDGVAANSIFGDRLGHEVNWAAHDPTTLAANLAASNLFVFFGSGDPGPLDTAVPTQPSFGQRPCGGRRSLGPEYRFSQPIDVSRRRP